MLGFALRPQKRLADLSEREILALAIALEEEDGRIYRDYVDGLRDDYPASARVFEEMAAEESGHRRMLIDLFRERYGEHIPLVRREDVRGFLRRRPLWLSRPLKIEAVRRQAEELEAEAQNFYRKAAARVSDAGLRKLLVDLAEAEADHVSLAHRLEEKHLAGDAAASEERAAHRRFVLQFVQPGLAGLMDGSVSTLAPLFAAAFATGDSWSAFLVGLAASIGAGISMGFAEALSDDGQLTGRGHPWLRGWVCGFMTTLGGVGHTLPYLIPDFQIATALAVAVVLVELWAIAWIRARYMDTPFLQAAYQIVLGGFLVFLSGILIGNA
ncbi:iron exporter MbfA [Marinimicrococcus flavescens]|uniref:Ferritin family protein n=1 Tax=Marinimicrococcus flavescens TaxID=3031815 RepID=A0AAP3UXA2_9PROT|nr:ferritin family protein [Marinimicrococcus flavescens]